MLNWTLISEKMPPNSKNSAMDMDVDNAGETKLLTYILAKVYLPYYTLQNEWNIIQAYRVSIIEIQHYEIEM